MVTIHNTTINKIESCLFLKKYHEWYSDRIKLPAACQGTNPGGVTKTYLKMPRLMNNKFTIILLLN